VCNDLINKIIDECLDKNLCGIKVLYDEPMSKHTTFKVGGTADCFITGQQIDGNEEKYSAFFVDLLNSAKKEGVPVFILGGGANIVVSDKGIRGIVLDMSLWAGKSTLCESENKIVFKSGTTLDDAADAARAAGLSGLEFLAGMPGTIGGAVWMNARCYGSEISDVICNAEYAAGSEQCGYSVKKIEIKNGEGFSYKKSPFQSMDCLILNASFKLKKGDKNKMLAQTEKYRKDRREKGHYFFPSAGSAFKNNHDFCKPTGQIIDELGLKGFQIGGAQIAPFHGNIIINTKNASAADIRNLTEEISVKVRNAAGLILEPEILFVGEW